jgi:pyridoxine 4-dehydrogenase
MVTGQIKSFDDLPEGDFRRYMPRFQPENFALNLKLVEQVKALADKKGCTPAQLAIGWSRGISKRPGMPTIIPMPGATTAARVAENSVEIDLTEDELAEIDTTLAKIDIVGARYPEHVPTNT